MKEPGRYRKRPVDVTAIRWTGDNAEAVEAFVASQPAGDVVVHHDATLSLWIVKSDTWRHSIPVGDWVIAELDGVGFYPCTAEQFDEIYEPADDPDPEPR